MRVSRKQKISVLLLIILAFLLLIPGVASANTYDLEPVSDSDYNFIVGDTATIHMRIVDDDGRSFSGTVISATITDPDGDKESYSPSGQSNLTISNVVFDTPGTYSLRVRIEYETDEDPVTTVTETLKQSIYVEDIELTTEGTMIVNDSSPTHFITVTITDSDDDVLSERNNS